MVDNKYMKLNIKEILFDKKKYALISLIIMAVTIMLVLLAALTNGLKNDSISTLDYLKIKGLLLEKTQSKTVSMQASNLDSTEIAQITAGVPPQDYFQFGVTNGEIKYNNSIEPLMIVGVGNPQIVTDGHPKISTKLAKDLNIGQNSPIEVNRKSTYPIDVIPDDIRFAHSPVILTSISDWQKIAGKTGVISALAFTENPQLQVDSNHYQMFSGDSLYDTIPGYSNEHSSLLAIQMLVLAISGLITGAFFIIVIYQKVKIISVMRALGAGRGFIAKNGFNEISLILLFSSGLGAIIGYALFYGLNKSSEIPMYLSIYTVLLIVLEMIIAGIIGAAVGIYQSTKFDPLIVISKS